MGENTREIVLDTLLELEKGREYSHRLIKAVLDKYDYLAARDKAFIKRLTEGVLERRLEFDYYLNHFSSVPVRKMKPLIRNLLYLSLYQLLYMDGIPDSAVCNEACRLAAKRGFQNLKGFVNGVLRSIARQKDSLPLPDQETQRDLYDSVKYSMPLEIVQMWLEEYGITVTERLLEGLLQIHPVSLRFRTGLSAEEREGWVERIRESGARIKASPYLPYVYTVENTESIAALPGFSQGVFTVQDASSALAVETAGIGPKDFVADVCAAPGGKTLLAAERAQRVLARDVSEAKKALILENAERMRAENITVQVYDATHTDEALLGKADVLFLDVPCSGLGVLGKKRDIKYHVTKESMAELEKLQKLIIEKSWGYVKPGGTLVYSTCTIHRAENEDMVRYITEHFPFEPESIEPFLPRALFRQREQIRLQAKGEDFKLTKKEASACIQLLPGYMETDGFFIARFKRTG